MKSSVFVLFLGLTFMTCQSNRFDSEFKCKNVSTLKNLENVQDFQKGFSVNIPMNWKTNLYFDDRQSEIFCADTTKVLQDTYVMNFALINGKIEIDEKFQKQVVSVTTENKLVTIADKFVDFDKYKGYYHIGKGIDNSNDIQVFQYYIKLSEEQYFLIKTDIYGTENVDDRLCESFQMIESLVIK